MTTVTFGQPNQTQHHSGCGDSVTCTARIHPACRAKGGKSHRMANIFLVRTPTTSLTSICYMAAHCSQGSMLLSATFSAGMMSRELGARFPSSCVLAATDPLSEQGPCVEALAPHTITYPLPRRRNCFTTWALGCLDNSPRAGLWS